MFPDDPPETPFSVIHLQGAFYLLFLGIFLSVVSIGVEMCIGRIQTTKRDTFNSKSDCALALVQLVPRSTDW